MSEAPSRPEAPSHGEARPGLPTVDVNEYGGKRDGERQKLDRRMFFQLLVFRSDKESAKLAKEVVQRLRAVEMHGVVYADTMDPRGFGLLTWSEAPEHFVQRVRPLFADLLADAELRNDFAMLGRTYSSGHEADLAHWLLQRPVENVNDAAFPWHVWYPLRRTGPFNRIEPHEQAMILREHAALGMAYGQLGIAHDVRLACHGLDASDNEFVIGLVGRDLYPLSHLVQAMRKTRQTAEFIAQMGPFFVGHVLERTALSPLAGAHHRGGKAEQPPGPGPTRPPARAAMAPRQAKTSCRHRALPAPSPALPPAPRAPSRIRSRSRSRSLFFLVKSPEVGPAAKRWGPEGVRTHPAPPRSLPDTCLLVLGRGGTGCRGPPGGTLRVPPRTPAAEREGAQPSLVSTTLK